MLDVVKVGSTGSLPLESFTNSSELCYIVELDAIFSEDISQDLRWKAVEACLLIGEVRHWHKSVLKYRVWGSLKVRAVKSRSGVLDGL